MRLIPPGPMSEEDLVSLYSNGFDVVSTGRSHIHTVNSLPSGEALVVHRDLRRRPTGNAPPGPGLETTRTTLMTGSSVTHDLRGAWKAEVTFVKGPLEGKVKSLELMLDADDADPPHAGGRSVQPPRGIGEWALEDDRLSYAFYEVLTDSAGRPTNVVHVRAKGTVDLDGQTFKAAGTGRSTGPAGSYSSPTTPLCAQPAPMRKEGNEAEPISLTAHGNPA